ncbi:MAG: alanine racemase [Dethiobacteria bacterium]|jgi:alanine racemase
MDISRYLGRPTWVEIDLSKLAANVRELRRFLPAGVQLLAVVKADAYGHGSYEVADVALREGATMLGVASLEEGKSLRKKGISAPILVLGYTDPGQSSSMLEMQLTPTILNWKAAVVFSQLARGQGKQAAVHVKLDTGMGRLGLHNPQEAMHFLEKIASLPGIMLEGVYTHFAQADATDPGFTLHQLNVFKNILQACQEKGIFIPLKHAANSAAALKFPQAHFDLVRVGIGLYGYSPAPNLQTGAPQLLPVMSLKSRIVFIKEVSAGAPISYGGIYTTPKKTTIATVALGYADGYNRLLSNRGAMLVGGKRTPVAGRVCMDYTMLDVGEVPLAREGDEVVAFGSQGCAEIGADELARLLGTISYEILCNTSKKVPRVYCEKGTVKDIKIF